MKKLLFISHEATRTGAPMLLLNLIAWLVEHRKNEYDITVWCVSGGELIPEFKKIVTTIDLNNKRQYRPYKLNKYIKKIVYKYSAYKLQQTWDLIFSNTIVNGKSLSFLKQPQTPVISYIHELESSIKIFQDRAQVAGTLKNTNTFLCGSKLVQQNLINNHMVDAKETKVVHSFVPFESNKKSEHKASALRSELNIPNDALVIGMMGSFIDRKGTDFFIETAERLTTENIYFIWVGADAQKIDPKLKEKINCLKLKLVPATKHYQQYFNVIDVFYLSSKEDPYPMVMVEASSYGIPILCFENAGGTQEFIDHKVGHVIPFGDTNSAATKILAYHNNRNNVEQHTEYIKTKSKMTHDVNVNAVIIDKVIRELLEKQ